ncbi:MAG: regulatory protein RecX [Gammaproteobacteria bacterium]
MNLLARREHSEKELLQKLRLRDFSEPDIQLVIQALVSEKLLSNSRFLENYIHHRRTKGFGPLRIQAELRARGIHEELIEHHLKITDNAWLADIQQVWKKRFKNRLPQDFKARAQQMRFLQYRGFTSEQIDSVFTSDD